MFEWLATVESIAWMGGKILLVVRYVRNFVSPAQPALHWIERLNASFSTELRIHRALTSEPKILLQGPLKLADDAKRAPA